MIRRLSSGSHYNVTNGAWGQMGGRRCFYADASTPRYTWGAHCGAISGKQVPIPPGPHEAQGPGANTDHKYIVIDTDAKRVYDIATHLDEDGTYGHALQGASMYSAKGRWVSPATKSDGPDTSPDAIPQGSRLQLSPSFNCGAISPPGIRAYCRIAQKYGIILMDTTPVHALTIYQEDVKDNPPATGNPFAEGYWGTDADWPPLAKVPLDQFRVVDPF
jgi:hypothetical protein